MVDEQSKSIGGQMREGDLIKAVWSDGLVLRGRYVGVVRGFVILIDHLGKNVVCDPNHVKFEVLEE